MKNMMTVVQTKKRITASVIALMQVQLKSSVPLNQMGEIMSQVEMTMCRDQSLKLKSQVQLLTKPWQKMMEQ